MKRKSDVAKLLWQNFWVMIGLVFLGIVIPYLMIIGLSSYYEDYKYQNLESAEKRMQDDYDAIETEDVVRQNGGVAIVTGEYKVIQLAGPSVFGKEQLTKGEWADFLRASGKLDVVGYDIAYNEREDFWLVLQVPVALTIQVDFAANSDSLENATVVKWMVFIICCYFLALGLCAFLYAKLVARRLTRPIQELGEFAGSLEQGNYEPCQVKSNLKEIRQLQSGLTHLSQELARHEKERDEMEQQQRELVMEISHDLKNPLASIQGYTELLQNQEEQLPKEKKKHYLELVHANAIRANELLLSLFYYSQIESRSFRLNREAVDICEYVRLIVAELLPMIEEHGMELAVEIPETVCACMVDKKMLHRAFENLIWNAVKYNPTGTKIDVEVHLETQDSVKIRVADNGVGIPKEEIKRIFMPFKRLEHKPQDSKDASSGLGLAIVKRVIELHGGTVCLHSDKGCGCEFCMELPKI